MLLSIIVPVYNSEKYIKETIDSIKEQLFTDWECIIVNDGSTDNSLQVINENIDSRFKVITIENGGVANARNIAVKEAQGKYILPVDSDDILYDDYTLEGIKYLEEHPECGLFHGGWSIIRDGQIVSECHSRWKDYASFFNQECFLICGIMRTERVREIGGWLNGLKRAEDYEFWIRYLYHYDNVKVSNTVGYGYRQLNTSRSQASAPYVVETSYKIMNMHKDKLVEFGKLLRIGFLDFKEIETVEKALSLNRTIYQKCNPYKQECDLVIISSNTKDKNFKGDPKVVTWELVLLNSLSIMTSLKLKKNFDEFKFAV